MRAGPGLREHCGRVGNSPFYKIGLFPFAFVPEFDRQIELKTPRGLLYDFRVGSAVTAVQSGIDALRFVPRY